MPPRGASEEEKLAYEAKFNLRASWRLTRHAGPDADGATRWRCPFCSGLLRSRAFPNTMRNSRTAPLVDVEAEHYCEGILTAIPAELPWWQSITVRDAWRVSRPRGRSWNRRTPPSRGAFADLSRGFFRVMGLVKTTVLLGFTLAAYNLDRVRSFKAKHGLGDDAQVVEKPKQHRARRRSGMWTEITEYGLAPPPT